VKKNLKLHNDDIMGIEGKDLEVSSWNWRVHTSKASGKMMLACTYYGDLSDRPITEYLPVLHDGYAGQKSMQQLFTIARSSDADLSQYSQLRDERGLQYISVQMSNSTPPSSIEYQMDGKFFRVMNRRWE